MKKHNFNGFKITVIAILLASCAGQPTQDNTATNKVVTEKPPVTASVALTSDQQNQLFKAVDHLQNNEIKQAERILKSLFKKSANNQHVASNYAVLLYKTNKTQQAKKIAQTFMQNTLAQNLLGLIALDEQQIKQAENHFLTAIKHDNKNALAYYNAALIYDTYHQNIQQAVRFYENYLRLLGTEDKETQQWVEELKASL